jgi:hypothetical protein
MALHPHKSSTFLLLNQYTFPLLSRSNTLLDRLRFLLTGEEADTVGAIELQLVIVTNFQVRTWVWPQKSG